VPVDSGCPRNGVVHLAKGGLDNGLELGDRRGFAQLGQPRFGAQATALEQRLGSLRRNGAFSPAMAGCSRHLRQLPAAYSR